jgi:hypothetical protein
MKLVNTMLVVEMLHWCAGGWILKGGCAGYEVSSKDERKLSLGSVQGGATSMAARVWWYSKGGEAGAELGNVTRPVELDGDFLSWRLGSCSGKQGIVAPAGSAIANSGAALRCRRHVPSRNGRASDL